MSMATVVPIRPSPVSPAPSATAEDLVRANGALRQGRFELVDGRLVKKPASFEASWTTGNVVFELKRYLRARPLGIVVVHQEYECFPQGATRVRVPDLSFILNHRIPSPRPTGFLRFVPDLAVEVVSSNERVYSLDAKLEDYRAAGFPLVWVLNPDSRLLRAHAPGRPIAEYRDGDVVTADPLLPGFAVAVGDLMPPAEGAV